MDPTAAAPALANRIFVWSYSETTAYTLESFDWYSPDLFGRLHFEVAQFIKNELELFYAEFSEYFNLAEFPDVPERLEPSEMAVFLKAAGVSDNADFSSIESRDDFSGLCAVIRHRLDQRSLEQTKLAAELFNWTIDFGLFSCDTNAHAILKVGSVEEVAPFLLERLLDRLPDDAKQRHEAQARPTGIEQRFLPLERVLTMLKETVDSPDWVQNQLALRIFFWIADTYKTELENDAG